MTEYIYKVSDAISALDEAFPLWTQDGWDNSGLLVGDASDPLRGILFSVDQTEATVDEAISLGCNLIVSHHPLMFRGLKRLTGSNAEQRTIIKALRSGVSLAAFHTPADKSIEGTSGSIGRLIGLSDLQVLDPEGSALCKVVVYVPCSHTEAVTDAMANAGAGHIGNYSHCAWRVAGMGQYRAEPGANPYIGSLGELHHEPEDRVEAICPRRLSAKVMSAIVKAHPYEEPAVDLIPLDNEWATLGYGVVGNLAGAMPVEDFIRHVKQRVGCSSVRFAGPEKDVRRVAICTGSGSEFVPNAVRAGADAYITADMKYHQMADAAEDIAVLDIGHYESEKITKCIFKDILTRKLANFARYEISKDANPVKYY